MKSYRKYEIAAGILFLLAMASYMAGSELVASSFATGAYSNQLKIGVFLEFVNSAAVVGIAALLFPIVQKHSEWASLVYVASRIIESVLLLISSACALFPLFIPETTAVTRESFLVFREISFQLAMIFLGAGSILLCWILLANRLIPRALSILGIIGYIALFLSGWAELYGLSGLGLILFVPGALFELILPVWLFAKGFTELDFTVKLIDRSTK